MNIVVSSSLICLISYLSSYFLFLFELFLEHVSFDLSSLCLLSSFQLMLEIDLVYDINNSIFLFTSMNGLYI